ncbi:phage holin family protein [Naumannella cuiyingiana]|uniref:Putative membrane protein n=1 Tax=Naumannella cuiyingiana TaxID=1347891 RepID=A0A7Z0D948_9ACTN|nr:phage holin family protein [Naumannella cuiyingiana]NYI71192.1 putative membrane protein [Naumannella cuiyingiana]
MRNFVIGTVTSALALWVTVALLPGVALIPYASGTLPAVLTYLAVALIFGLVNGIIAPVIKFVTFLFYVITLGLFGLLVNGFLFWLVSVISDQLGFGLRVDGFWWGVGGAIVMGIAAALIGLITGPLRKRETAR